MRAARVPPARAARARRREGGVGARGGRRRRGRPARSSLDPRARTSSRRARGSSGDLAGQVACSRVTRRSRGSAGVRYASSRLLRPSALRCTRKGGVADEHSGARDGPGLPTAPGRGGRGRGRPPSDRDMCNFRRFRVSFPPVSRVFSAGFACLFRRFRRKDGGRGGGLSRGCLDGGPSARRCGP